MSTGQGSLRVGREYVIYADESEKRGKYYSNFYGGALVRSKNLQEVWETLVATKARLGLGAEVKWGKVTDRYLDRYVALMDVLFALVASGKIKMRLMFTQNVHAPVNLSREQRENAYFLLYYQFVKHAFGLAHSNPSRQPVNCRLYFDKLPDTKEKVAVFKGHLCALSRSPEFRRARVRIDPDQIVEVDSHDHVVLKCLDVVLGAIQFRLNDKHKQKRPGSSRRGKKTVAKEKLYRHINRLIRSLYPNFNIGISTGVHGDVATHWHHAYRHWCFIPKEHRRDRTKAKP